MADRTSPTANTGRDDDANKGDEGETKQADSAAQFQEVSSWSGDDEEPSMQGVVKQND